MNPITMFHCDHVYSHVQVGLPKNFLLQSRELCSTREVGSVPSQHYVCSEKIDEIDWTVSSFDADGIRLEHPVRQTPEAEKEHHRDGWTVDGWIRFSPAGAFKWRDRSTAKTHRPATSLIAIALDYCSHLLANREERTRTGSPSAPSICTKSCRSMWETRRLRDPTPSLSCHLWRSSRLSISTNFRGRIYVINALLPGKRCWPPPFPPNCSWNCCDGENETRWMDRFLLTQQW